VSLLPTKKFTDLRVIGQVNATYLLLEGEEGLVIVDQHAAHERLTFERIRSLNRRLTSSPLLIPITVELESSMMALFLDHIDELYRLGIEAEAFSENHVVIRALPDFIRKEDARALFLDVLSELSEEGRSDSLDALYDGVCATIACHGSIRAGQRLSIPEIEALLVELDSIDFGAHCPHGRPVVKSFDESEIKKWFHRT
jgi:DNA mismatch repair protein MutL